MPLGMRPKYTLDNSQTEQDEVAIHDIIRWVKEKIAQAGRDVVVPGGKGKNIRVSLQQRR
jgi:hypothetical protein